MQVVTLGGVTGFGKRVAQVLDAEPTYGAMLVTGEPTRPMTEVVDSLLLDGDPEQPESALTLFGELAAIDNPIQTDDWQASLREAARRVYLATHAIPPVTRAERLLYRVYADPNLYQLIAAADPGDSLYTMVDLLALDCDPEDVEATLRLISQLASP